MARETVENLSEKAQQAIAQGKIEEAQAYYQQALLLRSDSPDIHYGLATVYFLRRELPTAAYHFKEVTRLDPTKAGAYVNLGAVYNRLEQYDEAIAALRKGISLDHNRAEGYYNLGLVYRKQGQMDMAIQAYREAVRVNPRMSDAHYNIGNIYLERGQLPQAINHYKLALEIRPGWEKASRGLEHAQKANVNPEPAPPESALKERFAPEPAATREPAVREAPVKAAAPDLDRHLDPQVHGDLLRTLHKAISDSEGQGRNLLNALVHEVETAIKELSHALLYPETSAMELTTHVQKFEQALANFRRQQDQLENSVERVRVLGEQLLKS